MPRPGYEFITGPPASTSRKRDLSFKRVASALVHRRRRHLSGQDELTQDVAELLGRGHVAQMAAALEGVERAPGDLRGELAGKLHRRVRSAVPCMTRVGS